MQSFQVPTMMAGQGSGTADQTLTMIMMLPSPMMLNQDVTNTPGFRPGTENQ